MNTIIFIILRRLRMPLLVLVGVYAVSVGGLVLIPGVDDQGRPWHFDFFHAFYFISYTSTTIGFGELPYSFTTAQRIWVIASIYLSVIGWLYGIGNILTLLQDPAFRRAIAEQRFTRKVKRLDAPFYIVCGYGETGRLLACSLLRQNVQAVVIDNEAERVAASDLEDLGMELPALYADVRDPAQLIRAGLQHPRCLGVVSVTDDDEANVEVAMSAKLLNPKLRVVCRAQSAAARVKLPAVHAERIVDPFTVFGEQLALALHKPSAHMLYEYLNSPAGESLPPNFTPPRGLWIICGYGRFGRAVDKRLREEGATTVVMEPNPERAPVGAIVGAGTNAASLRQAGIDQAVGIIAGTNSDTSNLAIALTARELNRELFVVARQNLDQNRMLFQSTQVNLTMQTSHIIVWRILAELINPLLARFLSLSQEQSEAWAANLFARMYAMCDNRTPDTWAVELNEAQAPALIEAFRAGRSVTMDLLLREPRAREQRIPCIPLLLERDGVATLLPAPETDLRPGDQLLFTAQVGAAQRMEWVFGAENVLEYVEAGIEYPDGYLWRRFHGRRRGVNAIMTMH